MAFNISNFRSDGLKYGGARPSLFDIILTPPSGISGGSTLSKQLSLLAQASQLPAVNLADIEVPYMGLKIKVLGDRTYSDWTVTVQNDEDFALRSMFEAWSNEMNAFVSNRNSFGSSALAYKVDAVVQQYGKAGPNGAGGVIRSYKMVGLWPKTISAINLDWAQTNSIETFDVTFALDWFEPEHFGGGQTYTPVLPDDGAV
jgi:hypothetical protein